MNRFCSFFSQLLGLFSRGDFERAVRESGAERKAKGLKCWEQFVAMLFCQLGQAHSLREIHGGLASSEGRLTHLGVAKAPARSSLSYANQHRSWELYRKVFHQILGRCHEVAQGHGKRFRFKNKLLSLDSTLIELCATMFDWAKYQKTKGAVKLHLLLDHQGYLPVFAHITGGHDSDLPTARALNFESGTILVVDRGYLDMRWFRQLHEKGVFFVTRMRDQMVWEVVEERPVDPEGPILHDQIIKMAGTRIRYPYHFRRVQYYDAETQKPLVFITNIMSFAASTIASIYRDRWKIELFFKALKQNLRIKSFVGTSSNALHIQIWTALIAMLLLRYLQLKARFNWSLSNLVALLRMNLFTYRDLMAWIDDPFDWKSHLAPPLQQYFPFTRLGQHKGVSF
jgi:hypothetical protein